MTPQQLFTDFLKDALQMPGHRPELIAGYARLLELRERKILKQIKEHVK
jgi:hypothetical protein